MQHLRHRSLLRVRVAWLPVAVAAMTCTLPAHAELPTRERVEGWLLRSCDLESDRAAASLQTEKKEVTELLLEAHRSGPRRQLVDQVREAAAKRFARRARVLGQPDSVGLSPRDLEGATTVEEEEFVARAVAGFVVGYRTQALRGLVVLQPSLARRLLSAEANDERSPLRRAARSMLRTSRRPPE